MHFWLQNKVVYKTKPPIGMEPFMLEVLWTLTPIYKVAAEYTVVSLFKIF